MRYKLAHTLAFVFVYMMGALAGHILTKPSLKGYGCEGVGDPNGVLYANEEDHFPFCSAIVSND